MEVCDILGAIGTSCPGWNRCVVSRIRNRLVAVTVPVRGAARRGRGASAVLEILQGSFRANAKCLLQHAERGALCAALDEHDLLLEKSTSDAVGMLAKAFHMKRRSPTWKRMAKLFKCKGRSVSHAYA